MATRYEQLVEEQRKRSRANFQETERVRQQSDSEVEAEIARKEAASSRYSGLVAGQRQSIIEEGAPTPTLRGGPLAGLQTPEVGPHGESLFDKPAPPKKPKAPEKPEPPKPPEPKPTNPAADLSAAAERARNLTADTATQPASSKSGGFDEKLAAIAANRGSVDYNDPTQFKAFIKASFDTLNPATEQPMPGGEQRAIDLQTLGQRQAQENKVGWELARNALGTEAASTMTAEDLRNFVRQTNASVAAGASEPTRSSSELQYAGAASAAKTTAGEAFLPTTQPSPLGVPQAGVIETGSFTGPGTYAGGPSVADMRQRLDEVNSVAQNNASQEQQSAASPLLGQPNQPPPPPKKDEEEE